MYVVDLYLYIYMLFKYLLNKALSICNNYNDFIKETIKIKEIFQLNGFPQYLVNKI